MLRRILKGAAERMLTAEPVTRLARRRRASSTLILAYHNIVPDGEPVAGDMSLHLPQRHFARQLDVLLETHEIVRLTDILEPPPADARRPRAVITFDDATQGAMTAGVLELESRNMPATVFIAPAFVGGRPFWWDAITGRAGAVMGDELRQYALTNLAGSDAKIRKWAEDEGVPLRQPPTHQLCATEEQLHQAAGEEITFGSHTWSHPNLTAVSGAELADELAHPLQWLTERFDNVVRWLAYPYGFCNADVAAAALEAGYDGALRVDGGWISGGLTSGAAQLHMLPRYNIPAGLSVRGFQLRTSGLAR